MTAMIQGNSWLYTCLCHVSVFSLHLPIFCGRLLERRGSESTRLGLSPSWYFLAMCVFSFEKQANNTTFLVRWLGGLSDVRLGECTAQGPACGGTCPLQQIHESQLLGYFFPMILILYGIFLTFQLETVILYVQYCLYIYPWKVKMEGAQSCPTLQPHGLYWNSPGQNTGVGSLFLCQGIFPPRELNWGLILYQLSYQGSPVFSHSLYLYSHHSFLPLRTPFWDHSSFS